jgi:hypothetical protein
MPGAAYLFFFDLTASSTFKYHSDFNFPQVASLMVHDGVCCVLRVNTEWRGKKEAMGANGV